MNLIKILNFTKMLTLGIFASAAGGAVAIDVPEGVDTLHAIWNHTSSGGFHFTEDGTNVAWRSGSYVVVTNFGTRNFAFSGSEHFKATGKRMDAWGIRMDNEPSNKGWMSGDGSIAPGAGGWEFTQGGRISRGYATPCEHYRLRANQTWWCSHATKKAYVAVGTSVYGSTYTKSYINAADGVTSWTLDNLDLFIISPSNDLRNVDVRFQNGARLWLEGSYYDTDSSRTVWLEPSLQAHKVTFVGDGVKLQAGGKISGDDEGGKSSTAYTNLTAQSLAPTLELADGADMTGTDAHLGVPTLAASGSGESTVSGTWTVDRELTEVTLADGATLAMRGTFNEPAGTAAGFSVTGSGTFVVESTAWFLTGTIEVGAGTTLEIGGSKIFKATVAGAGDLKLTPTDDEILYVPSAAIAGHTGSITVTGGRVVFNRRADVEGRVTCTGTGTIDYGDEAADVITDAPRSEATLSVESGATLHVFGSGLTAATTLVLNGGNVHFYVSTTIASPVTVQRSSFVETDLASVTGTMSGFVTGVCTTKEPLANAGSTKPVGLGTRGVGTVVFTGGGSFNNEYNGLWALNGDLVMDGGAWGFTNYAYLGTCYTATKKNNGTWGKRVVIRNGAQVSFYQSSAFAQGRDDGGSAADESEIDVEGEATRVTFNKSGNIRLGANQSGGVFHLRGGRLTLDDNCAIYLGSESISRGDFYLDGGVLEMNEGVYRSSIRVAVYQGIARFIWNGGTLKLGAKFDRKYLFERTGSPTEGTDADKETALDQLSMRAKILGDGNVLDLTDMKGDVLTNCVAGLEQAEWYGTGTLTVKGGKKFVMNSYPDAAKIRLDGDGTEVELMSEAKVYDFAKSVEYEAKTPRLFYSTADAERTNLLVVACTYGGAASFASMKTNRTVTVADAVVAEGGQFDNATSLVSSGALSVTNLTFEAGATLAAVVDRANTPVFAVEGTLTLPETALKFAATKRERPAERTPVVFRAPSVVGSPSVWTPTASAGYAPVVVTGENGSVYLSRLGAALFLR